jgi:LacI family transcriptional regulator
MPTTMRDVAKRAGVSIITVSRVINETSYVREETQARVRAAIEELQYVPNQIASSLRSRQTKALALLLPTITNSFWTNIARGAEDEAEAYGYSLFLCNTDDDSDKEERYFDVLVRNRVGGILIVPSPLSTPRLHRLQQRQMPFVQIHRKLENIDSDVVRADGYGGVVALTEYLISAGHRRIAYVGGWLTMSIGQERLAGYEYALARAGITVDQSLVKVDRSLVKTDGYGQQSGYSLVRDLLQSAVKPDAMVIGNSRLAIGALNALREADMRVPQDVAVASFYDISALDNFSPFMITAIQPAYDMGRRGIRRLFARIADPALATEELVLPNRIMTDATAGISMLPDDSLLRLIPPVSRIGASPVSLQ